jgi:hypothetical protein
MPAAAFNAICAAEERDERQRAIEGCDGLLDDLIRWHLLPGDFTVIAPSRNRRGFQIRGRPRRCPPTTPNPSWSRSFAKLDFALHLPILPQIRSLPPTI